MKILQIATLITPEGSYGGPIRVALNQLLSLQRRGHEVLLVAGYSGYPPAAVPQQMLGVPVRLFPVLAPIPRTGFAGMASPSMLRWLRRHARQYQALHVHLARDLITMPAARLLLHLGLPYVLQTHGMIPAARTWPKRIFDSVATRRVMRSANVAFYLTPDERTSTEHFIGTARRLRWLPNGVPSPSQQYPAADNVEVLYLGRLHPRKRPDYFVDAAVRLAPKYPGVVFTLVGPDEGMGSTIIRKIAGSAYQNQIRWEGPLAPENTLSRMARCRLFVLPSINEPFPMSVLEALSLGKPVIITRSCGLSPVVESAKCGLAIAEDLESLCTAIDHLLSAHELLDDYSSAALKVAQEHFDMESVTDILEQAYGISIDSSPEGTPRQRTASRLARSDRPRERCHNELNMASSNKPSPSTNGATQ